MRIRMKDENHHFSFRLPTVFLFFILKRIGKESVLSRKEAKKLLRELRAFRKKNGSFLFLEVRSSDGGSFRIDI